MEVGRCQGYNAGNRQAVIGSGTTTSHTIPNLSNGTEYTVRVSATRTGANEGPASDEVMETPVMPTAPGVTVSETALTVTEQDATGDSYTVVLDTLPTADVDGDGGWAFGHGFDPDAGPGDADFHHGELGDGADGDGDGGQRWGHGGRHGGADPQRGERGHDYQGITIAVVAVTVEDNDTAQVTGVMVEPGNGQLVVSWTAVDNATGYQVQWKSGGQGYNAGNRQAVIGSGTTTSHTIPNLSNGTEYTVRVSATRTGANEGAPSAEVKGTPVAPTTRTVTLALSDASIGEDGTAVSTVTATVSPATASGSRAARASTPLTGRP